MTIDSRLPGESARDYAFRLLKSNIVSLDLKPGELISENELASKLGISRTPIREAIIELAKAAVIETYPQKGSFVSLIDNDRVEESRFLRRILDTSVIEEACRLATEEDIAELEDNVSLQEFYLSNNNVNKIYELDNQFHKLIYKVAKKSNIYEMSSNAMIHFDRVRALSVESVKDLKIVNDHRTMLEAIKAKDINKAVAAVEKHLERYSVDSEKICKEFPDYFSKALNP